MPYNLDLPPTIRRTNQTAGPDPDDWQLETASGTPIETYTRVGMSVDVWWEDFLDYVADNSSSVLNAINDITLLMIQKDWEVIAAT